MRGSQISPYNKVDPLKQQQMSIFLSPNIEKKKEGMMMIIMVVVVIMMMSRMKLIFQYQTSAVWNWNWNAAREGADISRVRSPRRCGVGGSWI